MGTVLCIGTLLPYETELTSGITSYGISLRLGHGCHDMGKANHMYLHLALDEKSVTERSKDHAVSILIRVVATAVIISRF